MSHKIVVDIQLRTCDEAGQSLDVTVPDYGQAMAEAKRRARREISLLRGANGPPLELLSEESELADWDDPHAILRFTFRISAEDLMGWQ
jgi:hypothetical protein